MISTAIINILMYFPIRIHSAFALLNVSGVWNIRGSRVFDFTLRLIIEGPWDSPETKKSNM